MSEFTATFPAILLFAPLAFAGALIFGITGFGSALITVPLATLFVPLPFALAVWAVIDLGSALRIGLENPQQAVRAEWGRIVPTVLLGVVLGVTLLVKLPRNATMVALGVFVIVYAVYSLAKGGRLATVHRRWAYLAGLAGGLTGTLFGAGGPPYAIYLSHRPLDKEQYRATLSRCSMFSISIRITAFAMTGLLAQPGVWNAVLIAAPASWLGLAVARRIFQRISRELLTRLVAALLIATGVSLLIRAAAA